MEKLWNVSAMRKITNEKKMKTERDEREGVLGSRERDNGGDERKEMIVVLF